MEQNAQDLAAVIEAMHSAFRKRDLDGIAAYWADDVEYEGPGVALRGKAARTADEKIWLDAFSENDVTVQARYCQADEVIDFCVMKGVHSGNLVLPGGVVLPPTGRRIEAQYVARYRILKGMVVRQQVMFDRLSVLEQLQAG